MLDDRQSYAIITLGACGVFWVKCSKTLKMVKQEVEGLQITNVLAREAEHTFPLRSQNMK